MTKYKYYLKKPKGEIAKDILKVLATTSVIAVAATSPYFIIRVLRAAFRERPHHEGSIRSAFYRLRKMGCIAIAEKNNQIYISLTEEGRKQAGWQQINDLMIKKPKKWDRLWRILIFDIPNKKRATREALRGLLKNLGFFQLQKSVWVHGYNCRDEIGLLKNFFNLSDNEMRMIVADNIGKDRALKKFFKIR